jgi:hypothetical protein
MSKGNNDIDKSTLLEIIKEVIGSNSLCHIEILPSITPVDHPHAEQDAEESARKAGTPYFLTINLKDAILWRTFKIGKTPAREDRLKTYPTLHQIAPAEGGHDLSAQRQQSLDNSSTIYHNNSPFGGRGGIAGVLQFHSQADYRKGQSERGRGRVCQARKGW